MNNNPSSDADHVSQSTKLTSGQTKMGKFFVDENLTIKTLDLPSREYSLQLRSSILFALHWLNINVLIRPDIGYKLSQRIQNGVSFNDRNNRYLMSSCLHWMNELQTTNSPQQILSRPLSSLSSEKYVEPSQEYFLSSRISNQVSGRTSNQVSNQTDRYKSSADTSNSVSAGQTPDNKSDVIPTGKPYLPSSLNHKSHTSPSLNRDLSPSITSQSGTKPDTSDTDIIETSPQNSEQSTDSESQQTSETQKDRPKFKRRTKLIQPVSRRPNSSLQEISSPLISPADVPDRQLDSGSESRAERFNQSTNSNRDHWRVRILIRPASYFQSGLLSPGRPIWSGTYRQLVRAQNKASKLGIPVINSNNDSSSQIGYSQIRYSQIEYSQIKSVTGIGAQTDKTGLDPNDDWPPLPSAKGPVSIDKADSNIISITRAEVEPPNEVLDKSQSPNYAQPIIPISVPDTNLVSNPIENKTENGDEVSVHDSESEESPIFQTEIQNHDLRREEIEPNADQIQSESISENETAPPKRSDDKSRATVDSNSNPNSDPNSNSELESELEQPSQLKKLELGSGLESPSNLETDLNISPQAPDSINDSSGSDLDESVPDDNSYFESNVSPVWPTVQSGFDVYRHSRLGPQ